MKRPIHPVLFVVIVGVIFFVGVIAWMMTKDGSSEIESFADCAAAGNPVMESYPRKCRANGQTFVEEISSDASVCKNTCGDGTCAEIVCLAVGCPCPETPQSCPGDCR